LPIGVCWVRREAGVVMACLATGVVFVVVQVIASYAMLRE
jgi:hypothetical protein